MLWSFDKAYVCFFHINPELMKKNLKDDLSMEISFTTIKKDIKGENESFIKNEEGKKIIDEENESSD